MRNAFSVDLEDWFCANNLKIPVEQWDRQELRVEQNTHRLLDLFDKHQVSATFFVLGWVAERVPELIREIERRGHEIASHGHSHRLLTEMTPDEFEEDLRRALAVTSQCTKTPIQGFRAPSFTVTKKTLWAVDILARNGFVYDSSIFPVGFHPDYGISDAPLQIHQQGKLTEVPMSVAEISSKRIPCSGGGYFRIFPYFVTKRLMKLCNKQGRPVIFYIHPWEIDPDQPRRKMTMTKSLRHYSNLSRTFGRLDNLLTDFQFTTIRNLIDNE